MKIYLYVSGEQRGPYAESEIQAMWNNGQVTGDALYWHEGMAEWAPVPALLGNAPPPLPPATPIKPERPRYDVETDSFRATMAQMMKLAMRAIQNLGWKLDNVNETLGLVTFQTGISWGS